jgi:hypothetical protein
MPNVGIVATLAALAAVLLCAGSAKVAMPHSAARGLSSVLGRGRRASPALVRSFAFVEVAVAFALFWHATRPAGLIVASGIGLVFIGLGLLGLARRVRKPCGCFGRSTGRPLGRVNVLAGVVILIGSAMLFVLTRSAPTGGSEAVLPVTSVFTLGLAMWAYRDLLTGLIRSQGLIRRRQSV